MKPGHYATVSEFKLPLVCHCEREIAERARSAMQSNNKQGEDSLGPAIQPHKAQEFKPLIQNSEGLLPIDVTDTTIARHECAQRRQQHRVYPSRIWWEFSAVNDSFPTNISQVLEISSRLPKNSQDAQAHASNQRELHTHYKLASAVIRGHSAPQTQFSRKSDRRRRS